MLNLSKKFPRYSVEITALLAGLLLPFSFAPYELFWLQFPLLAYLFFICLQQTPKVTFLRAFLFSFGYFAHGIHWIYYSLHYHGGAPVFLAVVIIFLLAIYLSLFPALALYLSNKLFKNNKTMIQLLVYATSWMLFDWLRGYFLTGFPWLQLGVAHVDTWLSGYASLMGGLGVGFIVTIIAAALAYAVIEKRPLYILVTVAVCYLAGYLLQQINWTQPVGEPIKVSLVQGNIPQAEKWRRDMYAPTLQMYRQLTQKHMESDLIIWPETAIPGYKYRVTDYLDNLALEAEKNNTEVLLGLFVRDIQKQRYYNSLIDLNGQEYQKRHLVPLGEYFPLRSLLSIVEQWIHIPMSDLDSGEKNQPLIKVAGHPVGISICFEDAFDREVLTDLPEARLLINVSNDAWFEDSPQPWQHHQIARMRAIETGRTMLRVTNTGVSSVIDNKGHVLAISEQFKRQVLTHHVQAHQGATPYVIWGNALLVLSGLVALIFIYRKISK